MLGGRCGTGQLVKVRMTVIIKESEFWIVGNSRLGQWARCALNLTLFYARFNLKSEKDKA